MQLTVAVTERSPGVFTFRPVGSIDTATSSLLEEKVDSILKGPAKTMAFDMEGVNYISSAGIRVILKTQKSLKQRDGQFLMSNLQPQVKKVFEIINALPMMKIYSNTQELDRYLDAIQRKMTGEDDE
jgi:anti-sigma B factor antagonist